MNILPIKLLAGTHANTGETGQGCFMNVVAYLNGEAQITDQSTCVCVTVRPIAIFANDLANDEQRQRLLPFLLRAMGSATSDKTEVSRRLDLLVAFANKQAKYAAESAESAESAKYAEYAAEYTKYATKYAVESAEYAAKYAAKSAEYATKYAVESAEYAAKSAAKSAEYAAKSAVESAEYAAKYAAKSAEYATKYAVESAEYAAKSAAARAKIFDDCIEYLDAALPKMETATDAVLERAKKLYEMATI